MTDNELLNTLNAEYGGEVSERVRSAFRDQDRLRKILLILNDHLNATLKIPITGEGIDRFKEF